MSEEQVKIVRLESMRAARGWAFGPSPEDAAWKLLEGWARPRGLLDAGSGNRCFGFNNPSPTQGSPNYGYEFWVTMGSGIEGSEGVTVGELPGGLYAMAPFEGDADNPGESIPAAWRDLDAWVDAHGYQHGAHQWLEEHTLEGKIRALYYPIVG
jgi:DNA gyrase inhibitor GyrI